MTTERESDKRNISVNTENLFPIIKKWLYSDKEIFLREIVSNACDAVTKMRRLTSLGQIEGPQDADYRVDVVLDKDAGTLTVSDNGIGMTKEEIEKYICSIALSGAVDFMTKYEKDSASDGIIGHFGLGFYSAFMVSEKVEVRSRSYEGGDTSLWVCGDDGAYVFEETDERSRGTDVIMHLSEEEGKEFLDSSRLREILDKYCAFMPVNIYFRDGEKEDGDGEKEEKPVNDTHPLWLKNASDCTDEEYSAFYRKVFNDYREPLFHIHLAADYPLNFRGILYFPKLSSEFESVEGQVKLYYNQVFVADNIKEVIPDYFLMLKGVIDCPELPLNVSRSYLQNSGYVQKIAAYIVKKTADKLNGLFNTDRPAYEKLWGDVKLFVEYGCLRDKKFYDRVKSSLLLPLTDGSFVTLDEYKEAAKDKNDGKVFYTTDKVLQAQYVSMYEAQGIRVAVLDRVLDTQFLSLLESTEQVKFLRVDAEVSDALRSEKEAAESEDLAALFKKAAGSDALEVRFAALKDESVPAILSVEEESRRMSDFLKIYGMGDPGTAEKISIVLNTASPLIEKLKNCADAEKKEAAAAQIYALALLGQRQLTAEELKNLLSVSFKALEMGL